jgi:drug/metabolite transporter (DMT)-like permease
MQGMTRANSRGIAAMIVAMAAFVVQDSFVKLAAASWPTGQVLVVRGVFACFFALCLVIALGHARELRLLASPPALFRSAVEALLALSFISALAMLPLADITAIILVSPLLITAGSAVLLQERVGWRRWLAVAAGLAGMLLVIKPGGAGYGTASALAVACAFLVAIRDLYTRMIKAEIPSPVLAQGSAIGTVIAGGLLSLVAPWAAFDARALMYLALAAIFVVAGNYTVILAFRQAETSLVSPFRYTAIIWAAIAGYVVFGETPDHAGFAGIALIVASGLYTLHRERIRAAETPQAVR